jgi:hypothetical protein
MSHLAGRRGTSRPGPSDHREQLSLDLALGDRAPATVDDPSPHTRLAPTAPRPADIALPAPSRVAPLKGSDEMLARLRALGLPPGPDRGGIDRCRLTRNRAVMVSFRGGELRLHRGYLSAPDDVLRAVVAFVRARTAAQRRVAQRVILAFPAQAEDGAHAPAAPPRRQERTDPADEPMARVLADWHRRYNARYFGGALSPVSVRVSRRLRRRLGHYTAASAGGLPAEIVLSRSHIRRHGWEEALHTLLHEMVHQWQDETGLAIDHGAPFRRKAREVGITAAARRVVGRRGESAA